MNTYCKKVEEEAGSKDILRWGWLNLMFIQKCEHILNPNCCSPFLPTISLEKIFEEFKREYGLEEIDFRLINQGVILSALYTTLVVPNEILNSKVEVDYSDLEIKPEIFTVLTLNKKSYRSSDSLAHQEKERFIKHLRNSISHARYKFKKNTFIFWDRNHNSFYMEISMGGNIGSLINELFRFFIDRVR